MKSSTEWPPRPKTKAEGTPPSPLNEKECEAVTLARAGGGGEAGASEPELMEALEWAEKVRMDNVLLGMVLDGDLDFKFVDGEPVFTKKKART